MWNIFKDDNVINENAVVGFLSFFIMVVFAIFDLVTGMVYHTDLVINEIIYNSFVIVTLGSFGVSGVEKFAKK